MVFEVQSLDLFLEVIKEVEALAELDVSVECVRETQTDLFEVQESQGAGHLLRIE